MDKNQIHALISQQRSETLELKAVLPPSKTIAQLLASFANTLGGTILLGVLVRAGANQVKGLSGDFHALDITHKALDMLTPRPNVSFNYIQVEGKQLFFIQVGTSEGTVYVEGKHFIKVGSLTQEKPLQGAPSPSMEATGFSKVGDLYALFNGYKASSTGSKAKFLDHYLSTLRMFNDLGGILYPDSPLEPTSNPEGRILNRILFSSAMDNFETYLSDLLYEIFLAKPETLKSEQKVTITEVLNCADLQEFVHYWAKQKIGKLQKGSVAGFIKENQQIKDLNALSPGEQTELERLLQIRHLYSHRNGMVDEKFLAYFPVGHPINTEHRMPIDEICAKLKYVAGIVDKIDRAAIEKHSLST
ncbi:AlbA family DNA-binding domain-containing protein [Rufibacter quisquiliarum]|uniref:Schlafen AlbA-2 domain-containing protein n=1 Tax=Rufibacter quisquiliarum TaxID=1549639 RepID=A0A839GF19_9BACT|nr:ATP-binding protein [Rufibacter quisquiliarum]MBA9077090.1 hypothetical protein [Rufibacter quisquiliarum]